MAKKREHYAHTGTKITKLKIISKKKENGTNVKQSIFELIYIFSISIEKWSKKIRYEEIT